jgi:hypothetical protein
VEETFASKDANKAGIVFLTVEVERKKRKIKEVVGSI